MGCFEMFICCLVDRSLIHHSFTCKRIVKSEVRYFCCGLAAKCTKCLSESAKVQSCFIFDIYFTEIFLKLIYEMLCL